MAARVSRQWWIVTGVVGALVAAVALAARLAPTIRAVAVGSHAPDFEADDLRANRRARLHQLEGQVVLLNIWATWCQPCRIEMPSMERLYRELGPQGFKVVAVSIDEAGSEVVMEFVRQLGLTFDIWHDRSRRIERTYQTTGVPESFVINRQGVIVKKVIGATEWDAEVNRGLVRRLLAQGTARE